MQVSHEILTVLDHSQLIIMHARTDIIFALQQGGSTSFFRDHMHDVWTLLRAQGLPTDPNSGARYTQQENLNPYIREIIVDAMGICSLFNDIGNKTVDYIVFLEVLTSLCYRLLKFRSLRHAITRLDKQSAHHIGLIIFMMTLFLQNDRRRLINYNLVSIYLKKALEDELCDQNVEFFFWLAIIGGIWISDEADNKWIAPRIRIGAQQLGLASWEDARKIICKYPWVNGLHDQPGHMLWEWVYQLH